MKFVTLKVDNCVWDDLFKGTSFIETSVWWDAKKISIEAAIAFNHIKEVLRATAPKEALNEIH